MDHEPSSHSNANALAFMERLKKHTETYASALKDLFDREGSSETFNEALDDLVYEIAFENPEYVENANKLKSGRLSEQQARELAQAQREMISEIRHLVMQETGISTEEAGSDIEKAQAAIAGKLKGINLEEMANDEQSDAVLRSLGILQEDENGHAVFTYPAELFPDSINEKWDAYIASVENHLTIEKKVKRGDTPREDLQNADRIRRFAHNAVTSDLDEAFGFKSLPDSKWNFEDTRRLVAKMREAKFVGTPTSESKITSRALAQGFGRVGLSVLDKLSQRK